MPINTLNKKGIHIGISHDATVTPPLPQIGLYSSLTRKTIKGKVLGNKEKVNAEDALRFYTTSAAFHCFMEDKIGSLEKGKYADMAIWDKNPLTCNNEELIDLKCLMTFVDGKQVY
jgi:predicted amidohydrolase YtcJ